MNNGSVIVAQEQHSGKRVKIQLDTHGMMISIDNGYRGTFCTPALDEQILDLLVNVILDFKHKMAESRQRAAA